MKQKCVKVNYIRRIVMATFLAVGLSACAGAPRDGTSDLPGADADRLAAERAQLEADRAVLAQREAELARRLSELDAGMSGSPGGADGAAPDIYNSVLMPADPKPGECYAQVIVPAKFNITVSEVVKRPKSKRYEPVPAQFEQVTQTVEIKPASTRLEVIPAQYETVTEQVLIKPETRELVEVPARFEMVEEQVLVQPAKTKIVPVPAVYRWVETREIDEPAHTEWRRVTDLTSSSRDALASAAQTIERFGDYKVLDTRVEDAGVMCLVEIPATYKTVRREVLVSEASTEVVEVEPAKYETVKKMVQVAPPRTEERVIPAEYRTVQVVREVKPASTREITVPAEYGEVTVTKMVRPPGTREIEIPEQRATETTKTKIADAKIEWRPVLCKVNMTRDNVSALQSALTGTGACRCGPSRNECPADGLIGPCTIKAAQRFAIREGLAYGDSYITIDVIRALGLDF